MSEDYSERLSTSVSEDLKQQIRVEAAKRGMTMSEYVREILESEFDDTGKLKPATTPATA